MTSLASSEDIREARPSKGPLILEKSFSLVRLHKIWNTPGLSNGSETFELTIRYFEIPRSVKWTYELIEISGFPEYLTSLTKREIADLRSEIIRNIESILVVDSRMIRNLPQTLSFLS